MGSAHQTKWSSSLLITCVATHAVLVLHGFTSNIFLFFSPTWWISSMLIEINQSCSTCAAKDVVPYGPKGHLTSPLGCYYDFSFKLVKFPFAHYGRNVFYLLYRRSRKLLLLLILVPQNPFCPWSQQALFFIPLPWQPRSWGCSGASGMLTLKVRRAVLTRQSVTFTAVLHEHDVKFLPNRDVTF